MRMRVAAYALITRGDGVDGVILLPHWNEGGMSGWTLPGGGVEPGEHPADGAVREVKEETGYDVRLSSLLGVDSAVLPTSQHGDAMQALRILYRAEITGGELAVELEGTTDDVAWHPIASIPQLRHVHAVDWALSHLHDVGSPLREIKSRHLGLWELWAFCADSEPKAAERLAIAAEDLFGHSNRIDVNPRSDRLF